MEVDRRWLDAVVAQGVDDDTTGVELLADGAVGEDHASQANAGSRRPLSSDAIFSATKPFVASTAWTLIADGALDPDLPVVTWFPEFGENEKETITLEQVMPHTSGH
ncbi:MAG: beta-lactamase family protein, partial [Actinomycetia bacterium]|nr:beta-lactamase family protein [Actinomycetes bacterium]